MKKYIVTLDGEERRKLEALVNKGVVAVYRRTHAQILLLSESSDIFRLLSMTNFFT